MNLVENKRVGRAADYSDKDQDRIMLYEWDQDRWVYKSTVTRLEAHEWMGAHDLPRRRKPDSRESKLADVLVDLLGPGPEQDPERLRQAATAMTAWSSAQSALFGVCYELKAMRDLDDYSENRFKGWT